MTDGAGAAGAQAKTTKPRRPPARKTSRSRARAAPPTPAERAEQGKTARREAPRQNERDHRALIYAIESGRIPAQTDI